MADINVHDQQVLQMIFNPNLPLENMSNEEQQIDSDQNMEIQYDPETLTKVKELEMKAVKLAEDDKIKDALSCFDEAIALLPDYAPAYNNRAQARRMNNDKDGAYSDLDKAIALSKGKTASLAYTQRALLYKLDGDSNASLEDFKAAAKLGNAFAKQQVIDANPYAALCNKMLNDVIGKLRTGTEG